MTPRERNKLSRSPLEDRQRGMLTTFTAIVILVMLTLMMVYAVRAGVFEQRDSANDERQKLVFHAAESGIEQAKEFFRANSMLVGSYKVSLLPNGTNGWLAPGAAKWLKCSEAGLDLVHGQGTHPCFGEPIPSRRQNTYYYSVNDSTLLPLNTGNLFPTGSGEQVSVEALLCVVPEDFHSSVTTIEPCSLDPAVADGALWVATFLARGGAECSGGVCNANAKIAEKVAHAGAFAGGRSPAVPFTSKKGFPPSGTAEIVANPNGGGQGVPLSVWVNSNLSCPGQTPVDPSSGAWATCESHEWYGQDHVPSGVACTGNCSCSNDEAISTTSGVTDVFGYDLVVDESFPCDLFEYFFGIPRAQYEAIKSIATVITDCSTLNANSFGIYWATGTACNIGSNAVIGSPDAPVLLISAAGETRFNGGAKVYGILFITDVEVATAQVTSNGTNTTYGAVIVDGTVGSYNGTFRVIYNSHLIKRASGGGSLAGLAGGWTDFHLDWE